MTSTLGIVLAFRHMAYKLSFVSQKGGSGKTTLALALAVAHEQAGGRAAVIDMDPQRSALGWGHLRGEGSPLILRAHAPRLARIVDAAQREGVDFVVVDTAPREAGGAAEAARLTDLALVPCKPSAVDLMAIPATLAVSAGTRQAVVLNCCPPRGSWTAEAADAVREFGAELCPVNFGQRIAHARAFTSGRTAQETEPRSQAATEVAALYRWIMETTR